MQDFPRGGQLELTPLEYRQISDKAKRDLLFQESEEKSLKKVKITKNFIDSLSFKVAFY
jgi:hypothetical protein